MIIVSTDITRLHTNIPQPPTPPKKKIAGAFASVLMAKIGMQIPERGAYKPLVWKRYIRDIISLLHPNKYIVNQFIEASFLDTITWRKIQLGVRTNFKPIETFRYSFFTTCHPPGAKTGFFKGEALRRSRTNDYNLLSVTDNLVLEKWVKGSCDAKVWLKGRQAGIRISLWKLNDEGRLRIRPWKYL